MFARIVTGQNIAGNHRGKTVSVRKLLALDRNSIDGNGIRMPFCPVNREPERNRLFAFRAMSQRPKSETMAKPRCTVYVSHISRIEANLDSFALFQVRWLAPGQPLLTGDGCRKKYVLFVPAHPKIDGNARGK